MTTLQEGWYLHALSVAMRLHKGRIDASGQPRWLHNQQTAHHLTGRWPYGLTREVVEAAVLYDVLAAGAQMHELRQLSIRAGVIGIVQACTPPPELDRGDFLRRLSDAGDDDALRILTAAALDRLDPDRGYPCDVRARARLDLNILQPALREQVA